MSKTLTKIAQQLKDTDKKVQLIYAFNGTGKTRLSRKFKQLIAPKDNSGEDDEETDQFAWPRNKVLYYNAFTEDLFYWDNDLTGDAEPKLKIQPNSYTSWLLTLLKDLGQDGNIVRYFQRYANEKLTPHFSLDLTDVTFSLERGDNERSGHVKLSKGEESSFIWSIFYTLLDQAVTILNVAEPGERETGQFDQLEFVFVDDPVSSLDENHLIELSVNLASLIKSSQSQLRFIVTTHSPLFYNVLFNELKGKACYILERFEDGTFALTEKQGDTNKSFSYHLYLIEAIKQAIDDNKIERYHFTLLRNLYEKTASFLGYPKWSGLLPDDKQLYLSRIINFTSHSSLSNEVIAQPSPPEQQTVKFLLNHLINNYGFWQQETMNGDSHESR
ncbi:AAA family ATPase [Acidithiobacillus thiooxidans]|uniref:AAA family ATPase n=1 Tax=Acidithiobacillus thiooxidans TaxID=930 RepID=UPI0028638D94|nr:AAA family ATPase [Acidithiobacillus thiooxidans]MDR7928666.1 AAA family ATPase [Acidithiobacillus thiooxidans]